MVVRDGRLLLIQRGRGAAEGLWSVPGGRVEGGETLAQAVEREVAEETGLAVRCGRYLGYVERIGDDWHYVIHDFLAEADRDGPLVAADDASDARWYALERLHEVALVDGMLEFLIEHGVAPPPPTG